MMANQTQLSSGSVLQGGKYRIEKVLGQGGFGINYLAEQVSLHRRVAVKEFFMKEYCNRDVGTSCVSIGTAGSRDLVEKFRAKFIKEAQLIAGLDHPNIIKIFDVFEENGTAYYVMEYLVGGSLSSYVESRGRLSESEATGFICQVGSALSYIHGMSINHLDVKPGNILLDGKGRAVLIDFGLSKRYDETGSQTSSTPVGISHGYAPMELYKPAGVGTFSPTTDVYSLGATLYKLLTGQTPPDADVINDEGFPEWSVNISAPIRKAIEKAMQPRRKDRVQSVASFIEMLTATPESQSQDESTTLGAPDEEATVIGGKNNNSGSKPNPGPSPKPVRKWKRWIIPCVIVFCVLVSTGLWFLLPKLMISHDVTGTIGDYEYVDLGLSVKWATKNVGALSPSDYGDYYAETGKKLEYNYSNSLTYRKDFTGISDNSVFDVAKKMRGGSWRLPKVSELNELKNRCTWVWAIYNGHKGYKVTGPNGNSIFLPAAGFRFGYSLVSAEDLGSYWGYVPDSNDSTYSYILSFYSGVQSVDYNIGRGYGRTVRPVVSTIAPQLDKARKNLEAIEEAVSDDAKKSAPPFGF